MEFTATGLFLTLAGVLPDYRGAWGASIAGLVTDGQCGTALLALLRCWPQGDAHASWCCSPPARSHRPSGTRGGDSEATRSALPGRHLRPDARERMGTGSGDHPLRAIDRRECESGYARAVPKISDGRGIRRAHPGTIGTGRALHRILPQ